jgi:hypothetical protein
LLSEPQSALLVGKISGATYDGPSSFVPLKEKIISDYFVIMEQSRHFFLDVLNDKIVQLHESGIMGKLIEIPKPMENISNSDPVSLSLDHLLIWFQLWLILLLIAACFFFAEVLAGRCKKSPK